MTYLPRELPKAYSVLRLCKFDKIVITRGDQPSTALPDVQPKPDQSFIATVWWRGKEWLSADGNSETQALKALNFEVGSYYT